MIAKHYNMKIENYINIINIKWENENDFYWTPLLSKRINREFVLYFEYVSDWIDLQNTNLIRLILFQFNSSIIDCINSHFGSNFINLLLLGHIELHKETGEKKYDLWIIGSNKL